MSRRARAYACRLTAASRRSWKASPQNSMNTVQKSRLSTAVRRHARMTARSRSRAVRAPRDSEATRRSRSTVTRRAAAASIAALSRK